jgi:hypothetical protein
VVRICQFLAEPLPRCRRDDHRRSTMKLGCSGGIRNAILDCDTSVSSRAGPHYVQAYQIAASDSPNLAKETEMNTTAILPSVLLACAVASGCTPSGAGSTSKRPIPDWSARRRLVPTRAIGARPRQDATEASSCFAASVRRDRTRTAVVAGSCSHSSCHGFFLFVA